MQWLTVAQWIFNGVMLVFMAYVARKNQQIDQLQQRLEQATDQRISDRFATISRELQLRMDVLNASLAEVNKRLERGDGTFDELGERNQRIELQVTARVGEMRTWMVEQFASKSDVREMNKRFEALQQAVAHACHAVCPFDGSLRPGGRTTGQRPVPLEG